MIKPKTFAGAYAGQRYTCTFDPIAKAWVWRVEYMRTYSHFGAASSPFVAASQARRHINRMNARVIREEEME